MVSEPSQQGICDLHSLKNEFLFGKLCLIVALYLSNFLTKNVDMI